MIQIGYKRKILVKIIDFIFFVFYLPFLLFKKKTHQSLENSRKILVLELWGIGDLVMASSALKSLRKAFPGATITVLAKDYARDLLKEEGVVDFFVAFEFPWTRHKGKYNFWTWDLSGLFKIIAFLRRKKFDLAIDARMDFRNNLLLALINAKRRIGYSLTGGGFFLTDKVDSPKQVMHRVDAWVDLLKFMSIDIENINPKLTVSLKEKEWAENFLLSKGVSKGDFVAGIHPGAGVKKRCWPLDRFKETAKYLFSKYSIKSLLFIEPNGYGQEIDDSELFVMVRPNLRELLALISVCDLFLCNDGGPMHMATALGPWTVAIFGPGNLDIVKPLGVKNRVIIKEGFSCRPCRDYCRYAQARCLTSIETEEVEKVLDEVISGNNLYNKKY